MVDLQEDGLWPLIVESLRRHELEVRRVEGIFCPAEGCGGYFKRGEEWLMHAAEWHQQEWMSGERFRTLPGGIREEFERQGKRLEKQREELGQETRKRLDEWREGGEEKQEEMRARWAKQLEFDTGWEIEDEEVRNRVWNDYWQLMDGQV
jgi:peptidoglycan/xylan/chitin deacetylase (PgdA/CDA1 family)